MRWRPSRWPSCSSGEYSRHTARSRAPCDAPCVRGEPRAYTCVDSLGAPASGRLTDAQGENHVLKRYESGTTLPPPARAPAMPSQSAPIAIAGARAGGDTGGRSGVSPMESDDESTFPISRSWDDIEGARRCISLVCESGLVLHQMDASVGWAPIAPPPTHSPTARWQHPQPQLAPRFPPHDRHKSPLLKPAHLLLVAHRRGFRGWAAAAQGPVPLPGAAVTTGRRLGLGFTSGSGWAAGRAGVHVGGLHVSTMHART